jgi:hypothetical protein
MNDPSGRAVANVHSDAYESVIKFCSRLVKETPQL